MNQKPLTILEYEFLLKKPLAMASDWEIDQRTLHNHLKYKLASHYYERVLRMSFEQGTTIILMRRELIETSWSDVKYLRAVIRAMRSWDLTSVDATQVFEQNRDFVVLFKYPPVEYLKAHLARWKYCLVQSGRVVYL